MSTRPGLSYDPLFSGTDPPLSFIRLLRHPVRRLSIALGRRNVGHLVPFGTSKSPSSRLLPHKPFTWTDSLYPLGLHYDLLIPVPQPPTVIRVEIVIVKDFSLKLNLNLRLNLIYDSYSKKVSPASILRKWEVLVHLLYPHSLPPVRSRPLIPCLDLMSDYLPNYIELTRPSPSPSHSSSRFSCSRNRIK